ncbi:response regulator, partial [Spirulina sp. CS-785/01]|uniref:response regulator n=1 Tax=Spirulina sp. CS-785/01 TaxID=3021716 RepID=UPI00232E7EFC
LCPLPSALCLRILITELLITGSVHPVSYIKVPFIVVGMRTKLRGEWFMQGTLNEIDIRSILQLIELGQRTGELFVETYSSSFDLRFDGSALSQSARRNLSYPNTPIQPFWFVFFVNGKIAYAADRSSSNLARLRDYLRHYQAEVQLSQWENYSPAVITPEYGCLWQLMEQRVITPPQGQNIMQRMIIETLFDLLGLRQGIFNFEMGSAIAPQLTTLEIGSSIPHIIKQVQQWKQFHPHIQSPTQCPIITDKNRLQTALPPKSYKHLIRWTDGKTSLRQLSRYLGRDLVAIARAIYPYVQKGWIQLVDRSPHDFRSRTPESPQTSPHVVCIDDELTLSKSVEYMLTPHGYQVTFLSDPLNALSEVFHLQPDLILCDIAMPELEGYELCAMLRSSTRFRHTPIIMLTGKEGFIDRVRARLVGATDYLTKPFRESELLMLIEKYIGQGQPLSSPPN